MASQENNWPRRRAIIAVTVMSAALLMYFVVVGVRAVALLLSGTALAVTMGAALLVLPLLGVWALWRELSFGARATRLVDELAAADLLPDDLGEGTSSGRPRRDLAGAVFAKYRDEAELAPDDWQAWARLGIVYDACGDRVRARQAMRKAIMLARA